MQRNRTIRKIVKPTSSVEHPSNIHRRDGVAKQSATNIPHVNINRTPNIVNTARPALSTIKYSTVPRRFDRETVYIIGGGPSLKNFDLGQLAGSRTIAINKAILFHSQADVLYWTDVRFYTWYKKEVDNYKGLKFALRPGSQYSDDVKVLKKGKTHGIETDRQTLAHGNNSGYAAINLAYHLGAKRIILLGFDMGSNGNDSHFHDGYPTKSTGDRIFHDKFLPGFKQLKSELKGTGVTVLNASPYSKLTVFPKITLEQALSFR
jgi:hypothetical protein